MPGGYLARKGAYAQRGRGGEGYRARKCSCPGVIEPESAHAQREREERVVSKNTLQLDYISIMH